MHEKEFKELMRALTVASRDEGLLQAFLEDILTPEELETLPRRWDIVQRLARGETQRNIADTLGIGIATVTRGARELKDKKGGFARVLAKTK